MRYEELVALPTELPVGAFASCNPYAHGLVISSSVEDPTLVTPEPQRRFGSRLLVAIRRGTCHAPDLPVPPSDQSQTVIPLCLFHVETFICIFLGQNDLVRRVLRSTANGLRSITQSSTAEGHRGGHPRLLQGVRQQHEISIEFTDTMCRRTCPETSLCLFQVAQQVVECR